VTLHSHVRYKEIVACTCCGPMFFSVKPYSHTMSMCVASARAEPFLQKLRGMGFGVYGLVFSV